MKKFLALLLTLALLAGLTACKDTEAASTAQEQIGRASCRERV